MTTCTHRASGLSTRLVSEAVSREKHSGELFATLPEVMTPAVVWATPGCSAKQPPYALKTHSKVLNDRHWTGSNLT